MAELLVKAVDATHPDPAKDARGCYKRGDVVCVQPDGHEWGRLEGLPRFVVVKVPGVSVDQAEAHLERSETRRRAVGIAWADLPAGVRQQLQTTGTVTVTPAQIRNFVKRKA